ncbi:hypothetical protein OCO_40330 [Mycobacterium intracellulare MOTT-02]|nr:hypothetical protein OCO_40330 [Mycobacterium intracellulare MOTT-02]
MTHRIENQLDQPRARSGYFRAEFGPRYRCPLPGVDPDRTDSGVALV